MSSKLLFFAGSARKDSVNKKLAKAAYDIAKKQGAVATFVDLADYEIPLYNQDIENKNGLPDNAKKLKQLFIEHDGFCIASPEYNGMITPLLKNTLDWVSRQEEEDDKPLIAYSGKTCLLMGASPGGLGGVRALQGITYMLSSIGVHVMPQPFALSGAYDKFDDEGTLTDDKTNKNLENNIQRFIKATNALK